MVLKDIQGLLRLCYGRILSRPGVVEVDDQRKSLLIRTHQVNDPLQHENQMLYLSVTPLGVLILRDEVQTRPRMNIVAEYHLLSCFILHRDIVRCQLV